MRCLMGSCGVGAKRVIVSSFISTLCTCGFLHLFVNIFLLCLDYSFYSSICTAVCTTCSVVPASERLR